MTIDEKKMYPGPFEDDKNVYGPLHLAPDVDQLGKQVNCDDGWNPRACLSFRLARSLTSSWARPPDF